MSAAKPKEFWEDIENRKRFFLNIARKLGFDPSKAKNWENVTNADIRMEKVGVDRFPKIHHLWPGIVGGRVVEEVWQCLPCPRGYLSQSNLYK